MKSAKKKSENASKITVTIAKDYAKTLLALKKQIQEAQVKAAVSVNKELIKLYYSIGKTITEKQEESGWGTSLIEKLAKDLQNMFPGVEGFSPRNVFRMRAFYLAYQKVTQAVSEINALHIEDLPIFSIPWGHNIMLFQKLKNDKERLWYAEKTIEHGWSRSVLEARINANLYKRVGQAITNFHQTLPSPQSDLAQQTLKDPYNFDFLTLHGEHLEKDLEDGLVAHIQKFLLELGQGFSFMGRQYPITVDGDLYYVDLMFYHVILRCFVVIELKAVPFKPEFTGQLNFYLSAVDDLLKQPHDNPRIGLLLCKSKSKIKAEYAFRYLNRPIGVAQYETMLTQALPKELKSKLPTVKEIEAELEEKEKVEKEQNKSKKKNKK